MSLGKGEGYPQAIKQLGGKKVLMIL